MTTDDKVYAAYLNAFASVRSGWPMKERVSHIKILLARALGTSDGSDLEYMPAPRWLVLDEVEHRLHSEKKEEEPCKVVAMDSVKEAP
jgi:hypothetical protein